MARYYDLAVFYKHSKEGITFKGQFPLITEGILKGIRKRFEKEYEEEDIVFLKFEIEVVQ